LRPAPKTFLGSYVRRILTLAFGCLGLVWGVLTAPQSEAFDEFQDMESHLLRFESFDKATLTRMLESPDSQNLSACDTHSQRSMLLMEVPLAEAALRSGATAEFDQRVQSLEVRSRRILTCTPRDSFVWLLAFNLELLHGRQAFDLLDMSYDTSPNEAWISMRRVNVAMPLVLVVSDSTRQKILSEFQQLIRFGFATEAARSYLAASLPVQSRLQTQIERLDLGEQKVFSDALQRLRS